MRAFLFKSLNYETMNNLMIFLDFLIDIKVWFQLHFGEERLCINGYEFFHLLFV